MSIQQPPAVAYNRATFDDLNAALTTLYANDTYLATTPGTPGPPGRDGSDGAPGRDGQDGAAGVGVASITRSGSQMVITLTDGTSVSLPLPEGMPGRDGRDGEDGQDGLDGADGRDGRDGRDGVDGAAGQPGRDGVGVSSVTRRDMDMVVTLTDGTQHVFEMPKGDKGDPGPSVADGDIPWTDTLSAWNQYGVTGGLFARYCIRSGMVSVVAANITVSSPVIHVRLPDALMPDYWAINTVASPCITDAGDVVGKATWWDQALDDRRMEIKCPQGSATPAFSFMLTYPVASS